ncbi:glycosyltransferase family 2 protein [Synechococcus sp. CCY 9618]|uniref:glycosyltransferase family 2 protein n=1 Tax=Synechococcus sp. CCY 9618 TaxID=2815602 RepID=UPI001C21DC36|nr:glycosyltransferase family 2 protein [Synechococcus sp. CCY 9618]
MNPEDGAIQAVIPVRDEEATISEVVRGLRAAGLERIRVVDNGSRDRSAEQARQAGATVLEEPLAGYGRACWRGYQDLDDAVAWVLFCDGDGSDPLERLGPFLAGRHDLDLLLADRTATLEGTAALTAVQRWGNRLATTLIALGWGHRYRDLGPLRLIRRDALEAMAMQDRGFGWTIEMQVKAIERGLRIAELPMGCHRRRAGRSKISGRLRAGGQAGLVILATLLKLYLGRRAGDLRRLIRSRPTGQR